MAANERLAVPLSRLRWILWGVVLLLAVAAGILYLVLRSSATTSSAVPVSDVPAATWKAGALRAPDFRLTDQNGAPVSLAALRGRPVIVTFIDPLCRNFCPIEARHLNEVVNAFPQAAKPAIVAVSVNVYGKANAHATLMQDAREWKLVPEWHWAIGHPNALGRVWSAYHIEVVATTKMVSGLNVHDVGHTEAAYVIDARGYERALFLWPYRARGVRQTLGTLTS
jgi:cytochrome oxidase Cu insertion factor (SCO1/SenC/PrrC family)